MSKNKIILFEKIDLVALDNILVNPDNFSSDKIHELKQYIYSLKKKNGGYNDTKRIEYHYKNEYNIGRLFANNSMQSFTKEIRNILLNNIYFDIDFVNWLGTALFYIIETNKNCLPVCSQITNYFKDREKFYDSIISHDQNKILKRSELKKIIISVVFGRDVKQYDNVILNNLSAECWYLASVISEKYKHSYDKLIMEDEMNLKKINSKIKRNGNSFNDSVPHKFSVLSYYVQSLENKCLLEMVNTFQSLDRKVGILMFDGCCVEKLNKDEKIFPKELIDLAIKNIKDKHGVDINIKQKDFDVAGFEWAYDSSNLYDKVTVKTAFNKFIELNKNNMFVQNKILYVKDPKTKEYVYDKDLLFEIITTDDNLIFTDKSGKEHDYTVGHNRECLLSEIERRKNFIAGICEDKNHKIINSVDKFMFRNGLYDFVEDKFYKNGEFDENDYIFFKDQIFTFDFEECFDEEKIKYLFESFYVNPYHINNRDSGIFSLDAVSFMLRGRSDIRNILISYGPMRCGKGENTTLMMKSFRGFVSGFDINDLMIPRKGKVENNTLDKRWLSEIILNRVRVMISSEIKECDDMIIDIGFLKKLNSGGSDIIKFRNLFGNDVQGVCHAGSIIHVNEIEFLGNIDKPTRGRLNVDQKDISFVSKEHIENIKNQSEADPLLRTRINDPSYHKAMVGLVIEHVRRRGLNGKTELYIPPCVQSNTDQLIDMPEELFMIAIEDNFIIGENEKTTFTAIKKAIEYLKLSDKMISRLLKKCEFKKSLDKRFVLGLGVRNVIGEETEFDIFKRKLLNIFKLTHNKKDIVSFKLIKEKINMDISDNVVGKYLDDLGLNCIKKNTGKFRECITLLD